MPRWTRLVLLGAGGHASDVLRVVDAVNDHQPSYRIGGASYATDAGPASTLVRPGADLGRKIFGGDGSVVVGDARLLPRVRIGSHAHLSYLS